MPLRSALCRRAISELQEHAVEAQLAGGGYLLEQRRAHLEHRHRAAGADGGGALGAGHVAGLAEAVAGVERTDALAVALHHAAAAHQDVEAVVHLAFLDDLLAARVVLPAAGAQHFPDLGMRELVEELAAGAARRTAPGGRCASSASRSRWCTRVSSAAKSSPLLQRFSGSFCIALATTISSSSGTSLRSVWIGGGVAYTIWCSSFCRLPARNGRDAGEQLVHHRAERIQVRAVA